MATYDLDTQRNIAQAMQNFEMNQRRYQPQRPDSTSDFSLYQTIVDRQQNQQWAQDTGREVAWAIGQVVSYHAAGRTARRLIRMGAQTPERAMWIANRLSNCAASYFCMAFFFGPFVLMAVGGGAAMVASINRGAEHGSSVGWAVLMVVGLTILWLSRVLSGHLVHDHIKSLPKYDTASYRWYWPAETLHSGIKLTRLPTVVLDKERTLNDRLSYAFVALLWGAFMKFPYYYTLFIVAYSLASFVLPLPIGGE